MLKFRTLELGDFAKTAPFLKAAAGRLCDETPGTLFLWRKYYNVACAFENRRLFLSFEDGKDIKERHYAIPYGEDRVGGIEEIRRHCAEEGKRALFCAVSEENLKLLENNFKIIDSHEETDWSDYLYSAKVMIDLPGAHFGGQRNHIHQFEKTYPDFHEELLDVGTLDDARNFLQAFSEKYPDPTFMGNDEVHMTFELLDHYTEYGMEGIILYTGNGIAGFSIGEIVGDTLFVHIEKADRAYPGAYPKLTNLFARRFVCPGVEYINREEDLGDPGLRRSKQSYRPLALLRKFTVEIA